MSSEPKVDGSGGEPVAVDAAGEPKLMKQMVHALGVGGLLDPAERADAAAHCCTCTDVEACVSWLGVAEIRGADHVPGFCRNKDRFETLLSEAPSTI